LNSRKVKKIYCNCNIKIELKECEHTFSPLKKWSMSGSSISYGRLATRAQYGPFLGIRDSSMSDPLDALGAVGRTMRSLLIYSASEILLKGDYSVTNKIQHRTEDRTTKTKRAL